MVPASGSSRQYVSMSGASIVPVTASLTSRGPFRIRTIEHVSKNAYFWNQLLSEHQSGQARRQTDECQCWAYFAKKRPDSELTNILTVLRYPNSEGTPFWPTTRPELARKGSKTGWKSALPSCRHSTIIAVEFVNTGRPIGTKLDSISVYGSRQV